MAGWLSALALSALAESTCRAASFFVGNPSSNCATFLPEVSTRQRVATRKSARPSFGSAQSVAGPQFAVGGPVRGRWRDQVVAAVRLVLSGGTLLVHFLPFFGFRAGRRPDRLSFVAGHDSSPS